MVRHLTGDTDARLPSWSPTLPDSRAESLAKPTRPRIEVPIPMHRVVRRLTIAFSLAALLIAVGASGTLALSPNASCEAHITFGLGNPGEHQRNAQDPEFGHEVSRVARWAGNSFEECQEVFAAQ